jgi:hypothetical protein
VPLSSSSMENFVGSSLELLAVPAVEVEGKVYYVDRLHLPAAQSLAGTGTMPVNLDA